MILNLDSCDSTIQVTLHQLEGGVSKAEHFHLSKEDIMIRAIVSSALVRSNMAYVIASIPLLADKGVQLG